MNFKTIRKVGIPALLTGTFVLSAEDSSGAPTYKEATIATLTASRANLQMKRTFAEQEKLLTAEQKKLWKIFKSSPHFTSILPEIKLNMDISGIYESTGGIYIPFARCEDIAETDITIKDRYRKFPYKSIVFDPANRGYYSVCVHYFINNDYILPTYDVPDFIKYHHDCYFYTSKSELDKLSEQEKKYIQTLDKALNTIYHSIYVIGYAKIDTDKLKKGHLAAYLYNHYRLIGGTEYIDKSSLPKVLCANARQQREKNKEIMASWKRHVKKWETTTPRERNKGVRRKFSHWIKERSELETSFYDILGYPISVYDLIKSFAGNFSSSHYHICGGCFGEIYYSSGSSCLPGFTGIPFPEDLSKDFKALNAILDHIRERQAMNLHIRCWSLSKRIKYLLNENLPHGGTRHEAYLNGSPEFRQILEDKVNTVLLYNKRLCLNADRMTKEMPKCIADTRALDSYIKKNYALKVSDQNAAQAQNPGK